MAKVLRILCHWGVQLILACSWAKPVFPLGFKKGVVKILKKGTFYACMSIKRAFYA